MSPAPAAAVPPTASKAGTPPITRASATAFSPRPGAGPTVFVSSAPTSRRSLFIRKSVRRWPVSWQRIRGHDAVVRAFDGVVRSGRLAHAYLFTGPSGVGKRLFAGELAKALLCEAPPGPGLQACDACDACLQVEAGTHPDLITAGLPEDNLEVPIEVIRTLCRGLALKPARGRCKVAILDDADDLNEAAANCFLKTLEE